MTTRDDVICGFVDGYLAEHHFAPSVRDIGSFLGLSSTSTVMTHLEAAKRRGRLDWLRYQPRTFHTVKNE